VALLTSLVLALTFTPVVAERFIRIPAHEKGDEKGEDEEHHGPLLRRLIDAYEWILAHALRRTGIVFIIIIAVAALSYVAYRFLGSEFLPEFDEHGFILDYVAPPGASLDETDRMLRHVEQMLKATPEIESYSRRTGLQLGLAGVTEPNTGDFAVKVKESATTDDVTSALRKKIESSEPALRVEFLGILSDLIGDLVSSPSPIEIRLFSEDPAALRRTADQVAGVIGKIDGVVDVFNGVVVSGPAVTFRVDPQRAALFGLTANDVNEALTVALNGDVVSNVIEHGRSVGVRVWLAGPPRQLDELRALPLRSPVTNGTVRISQIASVDYDAGQTEIDRDGLRQTVAVTARLEGRDLGSAIRDIQAQMGRQVHLPAGMTVEYGGLYQEQQASFRELLIALALAVALVFIVLVIEFRSFTHPTAIVCGAVLALSGSLGALLLTHTTLNVVSMMGMIMIVGIVSKNGILMLDTVEDHLRSGVDLATALRASGRRRFRPVLMTSLAAMLGMLPLAVALGSGSELLQPLAICVIGGLLFALVLSLVVTPTVFAVLHRGDRPPAT
jgi:multidrug efflux pump subunit AcrB